ncbi:hypothetical protein [Natrarchaeobius chitinivorans]|uniref:Uncharacterized protein n=1 Tax=Natrarchaeobius chitinivorans TaxID=1679083 RepID=A0A3N6MEZ1_NATCH|nr:hypothetical protein [Natrarchaeobius chitinivorans]RQG92436.1 hypothetical protein EA473_16820 [Natrarchaeobius chitinivorans]
MRRSLVVAIAVLAIAFLFVGGPSLLFSPSTEGIAPEEDEEPELHIVSFDDSESGFWPYLNAREAHEKRSPLNVIVRGDADDVVRLLAQHGDGDWEEAEHDHFEAEELLDPAQNETDSAMDPDSDGESNTTVDAVRPVSPTDIPWSEADGTTRYAYVDPGPGEEAYWTTETLQLEDGEYYGYRYHIRLYESPNPDDQWIVMQTHSEHFDWFTLRHRVDGVEQAQSRLEGDLMAIPGVDLREDVSRIYLDNAGPSDADGWATKVDLTAMALAPIAIGLAARRERDVRAKSTGVIERAESGIDDQLTESDRARLEAASDRLEAGHLVLAGVVLTIILGVRIGGIALDRHASFLSAHAIAALLYPFIALGLPIATYAIASGLERRLDAALAASTSLAVAIWIDYSLLGVDVLPLDVVFQRAFVVVALGLIAAGAARRATRDSRLNDMVVFGVALWSLVLVGTLFGYL